MTNPLIAIIMGSKSDWETMIHATDTLDKLGIPYEVKIVSAHRTPDLLFQFAESAHERGIEVIIAGAGGAAHLPGMAAAKTHLPVLGVPVQSKALNGMDSLLSIVQMPAGVPVGTLAIEFFEKDGRLLANEMTPRVHNSGHWSIDGAIMSQLENQVRAVTDAPFGSTSPLGVCAMVNLVGKIPDVESILKMKGVHLHLYDKTPKPNRKIGHVNIVAESEAELMEKVEIVQRLVD